MVFLLTFFKQRDSKTFLEMKPTRLPTGFLVFFKGFLLGSDPWASCGVCCWLSFFFQFFFFFLILSFFWGGG